MSTPIFAAPWISGYVDHLLSEQIDQQQGCVAFGAVTAQADGAAEQIAGWAAPLTDEAFAATLAFVDGLRHYRATTLEVLAQALQVGQAGLVTEAKRALLVYEVDANRLY